VTATKKSEILFLAGFLTVGIDCGGIIRTSTCQETHLLRVNLAEGARFGRSSRNSFVVQLRKHFLRTATQNISKSEQSCDRFEQGWKAALFFGKALTAVSCKRDWLQLVLVVSCLVAVLQAVTASEPTASFNKPPRARVVTVFNSEATDAFRARPEVIREMVEQGLTNLIGKASVAESWRTLVSTQDVVGIKVFSVPGPNSGTRPAVVAAVVEGLLAAGLSPKNVVVWDKQVTDLRLAGFFDLADRYGIRVCGSAQAGYDERTFYSSSLIGNLIWGDVEFGKKGEGIGRKSFVSKLVSQELTKIINISPLLNNNLAGVTGNLYGLAYGSVDNFARFESDPGRLAMAVPEIYALAPLSDHVVLNIVDALICQYEGGERGYLHYSATLNELRFSRDPVALDVLSVQGLERLRQTSRAPELKPNSDLYSNAALLELGVNDLKRIQIDRFP
jgi:hypothetical protein